MLITLCLRVRMGGFKEYQDVDVTVYDPPDFEYIIPPALAAFNLSPIDVTVNFGRGGTASWDRGRRKPNRNRAAAEAEAEAREGRRVGTVHELLAAGAMHNAGRAAARAEAQRRAQMTQEERAAAAQIDKLANGGDVDYDYDYYDSDGIHNGVPPLEIYLLPTTLRGFLRARGLYLCCACV